MEKIFEINVKKTFTRSDMNELIPLVFKLTDTAQFEVGKLMARLHPMAASASEKNALIEQQISEIIDRWEGKIEKLGGHPKGLWLADFDSGTGYFCWKFPEVEVSFWHGYQDGFSSRKPL